MAKMMYSLMLSADVVNRIDRLAYERGTNRSALVNEILAEYVSCPTPEMKLREIFSRMEETLGLCDGFQRLGAPSDTIMSVRSALAYKYNPTLRYSVELYKTDSPRVGELRVSLRTRNAALIESLGGYYALWMREEERLTGVRTPYTVEGERFTRALVLRAEAGKQLSAPVELGEVIARYVDALDRGLKYCFAHAEDVPALLAGVRQIQAAYRAQNAVRV